MSKVVTKPVSEEVRTAIEAYVHKNYKSHVGKTLTVTENDSCYMVFKHKDGGPLILGKNVLG